MGDLSSQSSGDVPERWTMIRRRHWPHDDAWVVLHGAPIPEPDEVLEVFEVERVTDRGAVGALTANEAAMLEVLAREEIAKHEHPPHALLSARDKLADLAAPREAESGACDEGRDNDG